MTTKQFFLLIIASIIVFACNKSSSSSNKIDVSNIYKYNNQGDLMRLTDSRTIPFHFIPVGRFRLYYTLSALGHENFYQGWGNIQVIQ